MRNGVFTLLFVALLAGTAMSQLATIHDLQGSTALFLAGDRGASVAMIGDVNGDGFGDFVMGEPAAFFGQGRVVMVSGLDGTTLWTATGGNVGDAFGKSVALAGHTDGDGVPDVVVGAPGYDAGFGAQGRAYVLSGADGTVRWHRTGNVGSSFGFAVAGNSDYDGDGVDDIGVGAPTKAGFLAPDAGAIYVYDGTSGTLLLNVNNTVAGDQLGFSASGAGDFNGDGNEDFVFGAPYDDDAVGADCGRIEVWGDIADGSGSIKICQIFGAAAGDEFGYAVAGAGHTDHDGLTDILVGAPGEASGAFVSGGVHLLGGPIGLPRFHFAGSILSSTGVAVAGAGDVDGDYYADVVIGRPGPGLLLNGSGSIAVYSGRDGSLLASQSGTVANGDFGRSVGGGLDVNHDGLHDVIVGDPVDERVRTFGLPLTYPGSGEDLILQGTVNGGALVRWPDVHAAAGGDTLRVRLTSRYGLYTNTIPILLAQLHATGTPPAPVAGFPELHVNSGAIVVFDGNTAPLFAPAVLPVHGLNFAFVVPPGLAGQSVMFQGLSLSGSAFQGNPFFTATEGREFTL